MRYLIPDCFWPEGKQDLYKSHEAISILNTEEHPAYCKMTLYFEDRPKIGGFVLEVPAERTIHFHTCDLKNEQREPIPQGVGYAVVIECDRPVAVQYTRVDTTQVRLALGMTMALQMGS